MSSPGWYPDPSGQPNSFRYWNGQVWSHETSSTPYVGPPPSAALPPPPPPPAAPAPTPPPPPSRPPPPTQPMPTQPPPGWSPAPPAPPATSKSTGTGRQIALIVLIALLVAAVAVGAFFGVRALTDDSDDGDATDDTSASASPSASESESASESPSESPSASPTESPSETVDPSPTDDPSASPSAIASMCTTGTPQGGKAPGAVLRGGGLEAPRPNGFAPMGFDNAFVFADKVVSVARQVEPEWVAVYAMGGLDKDAGYTSLEQAAESVLTCMTGSSAFYDAFSDRTDQGSSALTVDGHDAWRITAEVRVDDPDVTVEGDITTVIVVDTGAPGSYGLFVSVVPIGAPMLIGQQEQVAGSIRVP